MSRKPDVRAKVRFLTTAEGGRASKAYSGFRPQFHYNGEESGWDSVLEFEVTEGAIPGDEVIANLSFLSPYFHSQRAMPGLQFELREGARVVALGTVDELLALEENAAKNKKYLLEQGDQRVS